MERSSLFFSFAAASRGKTEFICLRCGRILSFART